MMPPVVRAPDFAPSMPFEDQLPLWRKYRATGSKKLKRRLWEVNLGLAVHMANKFCAKWPRIDQDDAVQAACLYLEKAIRKFDHRSGNQFSTYACWWIRAGLEEEYERREIVHIPGGVSNVKASMHDPRREVLSLDAPVSASKDDTFKDLLPDNSDPVDERTRSAEVPRMLATLRRRERLVLRLRAEEKTLKEVAAVLGCSRERARQIESRAMKRLRARFAA